MSASANDLLTMIVLYDHPLDFPRHWVVREQYVCTGGAIRCSPEAGFFDTLDAAHAYVATRYPYAVRIQAPGVDPDPKIYEVFV